MTNLGMMLSKVVAVSLEALTHLIYLKMSLVEVVVVDLAVFFDDFFGGSGSSGSNEGSRGSDLRVSVSITLEQAAKGVEKEIKYHHHGECSKCDGSGASPGSNKVMCATCGGIGQVASNQGFISIRRTCPSHAVELE